MTRSQTHDLNRYSTITLLSHQDLLTVRYPMLLLKKITALMQLFLC